MSYLPKDLDCWGTYHLIVFSTQIHTIVNKIKKTRQRFLNSATNSFAKYYATMTLKNTKSEFHSTSSFVSIRDSELDHRLKLVCSKYSPVLAYELTCYAAACTDSYSTFH